MIKAFSIKSNDYMYVLYVSSLIKSVISLHSLINNKIGNKEQEIEDAKKAKEEEEEKKRIEADKKEKAIEKAKKEKEEKEKKEKEEKDKAWTGSYTQLFSKMFSSYIICV